ncbi:MAG: Toluene efflux pump outer membrane protein TtgI [Chlamydiae bacterium]|nr:Toluene efflux pump outer membrane protein TtgI [Chlamydiota bacterium]
MRIIPFCLIPLFLVGCFKVGPDFHTPCAPMQYDWMECEDDKIDCCDVVIDCWWEQFHDPKLSELISIAQMQNLDLKIAAYRILGARALLGITMGEWFPQLQEVVGDATRFKLSRNMPNGFLADRNYWDFNLGLSVAWELDFWGRFRRGIESASDELYASFANYDDVLVILQADVASVYVDIRTFEERIDILERNIKLQERSLQIVEARWEAGMVTELDVQQAKTLLYSTQARLPRLQADLQIVKNALAFLLGLTPDELACVLDEPGTIPVAPESLGVGIPGELLCRRPDIRRALYQTAAQSARIGVAISDLLPRISIGGFIGFESSADTTLTASGGGGKLLSADSFNYFLGPSFAWKVLNYGRLTNRVYFEYSRFYELLTNYKNTVLAAYQEVENGLISFVKSYEESGFLEESVTAAQRAAEVSRTQYVEGLADYTRVLETERSLVDQEEDLAITRGRIALSLIGTYKALGGGWQCKNLE